MLRRNLVLVALAIPATAVSAALLSTMNLSSKAPAPSQVEALPTARDAVAHPTTVVASKLPSQAVAPQQLDAAIEPSMPMTASRAFKRTTGQAVPMIADDDGPAQHSSATAAIAVAAHGGAGHDDRRASAPVRRIAAGGARAMPNRVTSHAGAMPVPQARPFGSMASPGALPSPASEGVPRAASALIPADCWLPEFEPLPLSVVFGDAASGQPIPLALNIINEDIQADVLACQVSIHAIGDDGESLGEVRPVADIAVTVEGESTALQSLPPLQAAEILPWLSRTQTFNVVATGVGQASGVEYASDNYLYAHVPSITVTLTPDLNVQAGDWVKVTIESDGPLGMPLTDVKLRLNGGAQLLQPGQSVFDDGTASDVLVSLGDFAAGASFVREVWFVAVDPVWALMCVQLEAQEILPQFNCAELWDDTYWIDWTDPGDDDGDVGDIGDGTVGDGGDDGEIEVMPASDPGDGGDE